MNNNDLMTALPIDLRSCGWRGGECPDDIARVSAVHKERYELICIYGETLGVLKPGAYMLGDQSYPTVGDFVRIEYNPAGESRIVETLPRRSVFNRREAGPKARAQAVAANFDYALIVTALNRDFNPRRLERYLSAAYDSGATPVIVLTKADLFPDYYQHICAAQDIAPGIAVYAISALTGEGLDALRGDILRPGNTLVLLGSSGVGKSSLINALAGQELMRVNVNRDVDASKGRHTTTHRQLLTLPGGVLIIDTPGMRELGMWKLNEGLAETFADVEEILSRGCRFSDCKHESEPGCAVLSALASGELSAERWQSYNTLRRESLFAADHESAMRAKRERNKAISIYAKQLKRERNSTR